MFIESFWIALIIILYISAIIYIYFSKTRYNETENMLQIVMHQKNEILTFLNSFSKNLRSAEELEKAMRETAKYVADLIGANAVCIFVMENDYLVVAGASGQFPPMHKSESEYVFSKPRFIMESLLNEKIQMGEGLVGLVAQNGEAILIEDASEDEYFANSPIFVDSFMAVPMITEGKVAGVICAINNIRKSKKIEPFSAEQFNALKFMAAQVIFANNIVKVYSNLSKQQRINQELEFAKKLQASLIPEYSPKLDRYEIYSFTKSAKEVSGDFYDFVNIDDNRILIVIGDACGKGIPACMLMAMTRTFIRANAERFSTLHDMIIALNEDLYRDTDAERFVTVACCLLDKNSGTIEYARAGHTELLLGRSDHTVRQIFPTGAACGLLPIEFSERYDIITFSFLEDMSLLLFSDGITEALNEKGEEFGLDALYEIFGNAVSEGKTPQEIVNTIIHDVNIYTKDTPQADDQTLVVIQGKLPDSKK
jgi:sigma-B regulation protein RsbU (phosphoserine phosphatase)